MAVPICQQTGIGWSGDKKWKRIDCDGFWKIRVNKYAIFVKLCSYNLI
jgi:hypothetical protein